MINGTAYSLRWAIWWCRGAAVLLASCSAAYLSAPGSSRPGLAALGLLLSAGHLAIAMITADIERLAQQTMNVDVS